MYFKGTYTALITPFRKDQHVDFEILEKLVERQVKSGVDGIVPVTLRRVPNSPS